MSSLLPELDVSIVVPVYNSQSTLEPLAEQLVSVLQGARLKFEIIFVEDGSRDSSWDILQSLQRKHPDCVTAVRLMRNFGQHNALMCGLRHSCGEVVVTIDDDLQNPPAEILKLLKALNESNHDVVYGTYEGKQHASWRNLGSNVVNTFYRMAFRTSVTVTSMRAIRREVVRGVLTYDLNFTFLDGLLAWTTTRVGSVPVRHEARQAGRSGYSLSKLFTLAVNLFTNFSLLPLQFVSVAGFFTAFAGITTGLWYLSRYLFGEVAVPGYASTIIAILVLGGVQLLGLGIIGEYLGRVHLNINRKPQYVERETVSRNPAAPHLSQSVRETV